MRLLEGKTGLILGIANDHSIAWGIARAMHAHGARLAISYAGPALQRRVQPLAEQVGADFVQQCDVSSDDEIHALFARVANDLGAIDVLVHAIAFANNEDLAGPFHATTRAGFHVALDVSVYSLIALAREALPCMRPGGCVLTLSYYGGEKVVPNYNVMGVAKAALEATTRYLAADLGPKNVRVNAISPGPVRTLSAAGVSGFKRMYREFSAIAPLRRNITIEDVGDVAVWLASDLAQSVTGEVVYVDGGFNILGVSAMTSPDSTDKGAQAPGG